LFRAAAQVGAFMPDKLEEYNDIASEHGLPVLPRIVHIIDEFPAFVHEGGSPLYRKLSTAASRLRKYGVNLVWAGTNWKADLIDTHVRRQFLTLIAFKCGDNNESRIILNQAGAEAITVKGRGYYATRGGDAVEFQAFYVPREEFKFALDNPRPLLPADIVFLVKWAIANHEGKFPIAKLATEMDGKEGRPKFSQWAIEQLSKDWETSGWLERGQTRGDGKEISVELRALVGAI